MQVGKTPLHGVVAACPAIALKISWRAPELLAPQKRDLKTTTYDYRRKAKLLSRILNGEM
jgi:hypothetical protein